jgi:hypothetical protein
MKKLLFLLIAATLIFGCKKEEEKPTGNGNGETEITYNDSLAGTNWAKADNSPDNIINYFLEFTDKENVKRIAKFKHGSPDNVSNFTYKYSAKEKKGIACSTADIYEFTFTIDGDCLVWQYGVKYYKQ